MAEGPAPFLSLGLATDGWLRQNAPALAEASEGAVLDGRFLAHLDVRSDNLCFRDGRAVLVDWNHAVVAPPDLDIAGWAPSLHAEGGPAPEEILPGAGPLAAVISGYFAQRAGRPEDPHGPARAPGAVHAAAHGPALGGARPGAGAARRTRGQRERFFTRTRQGRMIP